MSLDTGGANFTQDYDQWKTSIKWTLTYLATSVIFDADQMFSHCITLVLDFRPDAKYNFEKFFIQKKRFLKWYLVMRQPRHPVQISDQ